MVHGLPGREWVGDDCERLRTLRAEVSHAARVWARTHKLRCQWPGCKPRDAGSWLVDSSEISGDTNALCHQQVESSLWPVSSLNVCEMWGPRISTALEATCKREGIGRVTDAASMHERRKAQGVSPGEVVCSLVCRVSAALSSSILTHASRSRALGRRSQGSWLRGAIAANDTARSMASAIRRRVQYSLRPGRRRRPVGSVVRLAQRCSHSRCIASRGNPTRRACIA